MIPLSFIRCSIGKEHYGLEMNRVRSIQRIDLLRRNATDQKSRQDPLGWLPGRDRDLAVFGLAELLGREQAADASIARTNLQRIVVLSPLPGSGSRLWGLLVDHVSQVIQVPQAQVHPLAQIAINPRARYFGRVIQLQTDLILLLDPEQLYPHTMPVASELPPSLQPESVVEPLLRPFSKQAPLSVKPSRWGKIIRFSPAGSTGTVDFSFGLSISQIPEVLSSLPIIPVPGAPGFVLGLANWRGRPVPVIDLLQRLGLPAQDSRSTNGSNRLMIVRDSGDTQEGLLGGFLIHSTVHIHTLPVEHQPSKKSLPLDLGMTRGAIELEGEIMVIPDLGRILH